MTTVTEKPPVWFWIVSALALIWNLMGVMAYLSQVMMPPEVLEAMPEAERALYENTPAWATGAFALAVFGGALGCLFLLFRKVLASYLLILSFICILVQMFHAFFMSHSFEVFGPGAMVMPIMVLIIGFLLIMLARKGKAKGWLS